MKDSRYRPIPLQQIAQSGLDYLALGHVHACSGVQLAGKTAYAYPGCPEGRGFDELGDKGFLAGEVDKGSVKLRFVPFAKRRYEIVTVDVTGREPLEAICEALPQHTEADIYRVILTGERSAAWIPPPSPTSCRPGSTRWRCGIAPPCAVISGTAAARTPCGGCSCKKCGRNTTPPVRTSARPSSRRCGLPCPPWKTGICNATLTEEKTMKNILMIGTGGTIASEMTPEGLTPGAEQQAAAVVRAQDRRNVPCGLHSGL